MRRTIAVLATIAVGLTAVACGSGEAPTADLPASSDATPLEGNQAPVLREVRIQPEEPATGQLVRAVVSARDPEGDPVTLTYHWEIDAESHGEGAELLLDDVRKGANVKLTVVATDGSATSDPVSTEVRVIDRAPIVTGLAVTPPQTVAPGETVVVVAEGRDPDGDSVTFAYEWSLNGEPRQERGNTLSTRGLSQGDEVVVRVWATDGSSRSQPLTSAPVRVGSAHPEIVSRPPGFNEDGAFVYVVKANDPDGDRVLRYRLDDGPAGMQIDDVLGELTWRPRQDQEGVHPVAIVVQDSTGLETTQSFEVTVRRSAPPASGTE